MIDEEIINKPTIIITSIGRTGTVFFKYLFEQVLYDCYAVHEADRFTYARDVDNLFNKLKIISELGLLNTTIFKLMGKWGIKSLSDNRIIKKINEEEAKKLLLSYRKKFIENKKYEVFVESNYHYYGLIDIVNETFSNSKLIYILRDGRDWVRSFLNKGGLYSYKDWHTFFNTRLNPYMFDEDPFKDEWKQMSLFEKHCWAWKKMNEYALSTIKNNPNAKIIYFEDIFENKKKYENIKKLIEFVTNFPNYGNIKYNPNKIFLEKKMNKSQKNCFPHWRDWEQDLRLKFNLHCEPLMKKLGYGTENEWLQE